MRIFRNDMEARFVSRPNRFIVIADGPDGRIEAHCPNPGRMNELLLPEAPLILEYATQSPAGTKADRKRFGTKGSRRTRYSLQAVRHEEKIIPLDTTRSNRIAENLILPRLYPDMDEIRREVRIGGSRFDFLIENGDTSVLVEVKTCSLCREGVAMFPDAPTERGRRHVRELSVLCTKVESRMHGLILILIMHEDASRFVPNIHTDPEFSTTLADAVGPVSPATNQENLAIRAVSISADEKGDVRLIDESLPVDLQPVDLVHENRGIYLLVIRYDERRVVSVGALGERLIVPGWYVYTGSADGSMHTRIARHLRKRKRMHWHVDYLIARADSVAALPIYTRHDLECRLAQDVGRLGESCIDGFGSSDCGCPSHLTRFGEDPISSAAFIDLLLRYRHSEI